MQGLIDLANQANQLLTEGKYVGRVIHEINGKVMSSPATLELKRRWADVYERWTAFELTHPMMTSADPRLSREELQRSAVLLGVMKKQALETYARWKAEMKAAGVDVSGAAPAPAPLGPTTTAGGLAQMQGTGNGNGRMMKGLLVGAALVGGAAALQQLLSSWRNRGGIPVIPIANANSAFLPPGLPPGFEPMLAGIGQNPYVHPGYQELIAPVVPALGMNARTHRPLTFTLPPMPGSEDGAGGNDGYGDEE